MLVRSHKKNSTDVIEFMDAAPAGLREQSKVSVYMWWT